jgi:hypothetical protein
VSEQFSELAFSPEQDFLVRERLLWSIHVALSFSWPCCLRSDKAKICNNKNPPAKPSFAFGLGPVERGCDYVKNLLNLKN